MTQYAGRLFAIKKDGTTIAGVREKSVTYSGTPIDTTNDDDTGVASMLSGAFASEAMDVAISGISDSDVLSDLAYSTTPGDRHLTDITLDFPNGDVISGNFILTNFVRTGSYQDAMTFTASLVRNGAHTFTPAA
jgi:predicted secreted protein